MRSKEVISEKGWGVTSSETIENGLAFCIVKLFLFCKKQGLDVRLVGSLGRVVATGEAFPKIIHDVDILVLNCDSLTPGVRKKAESLVSPFKLEPIFQEAIIREEGRTFIRYRKLKMEINPRILEERFGFIGGFSVPTLDLQTLFHLNGLYGGMRPQDWQNSLSLARAIRKTPDSLPEELFEPFHQLFRLRRVEYPDDHFIDQIKWCYQKNFPPAITRRLRPLTGWFFRRLRESS